MDPYKDAMEQRRKNSQIDITHEAENIAQGAREDGTTDADDSGTVAQPSAGMGATKSAIDGAQSGKSGVSTAGNAAMTYGAMSGKPYVFGVGAGLSVLGAVSDKKEKDRAEEYAFQMKKAEMRQDALNRLNNTMQGLRNL